MSKAAYQIKPANLPLGRPKNSAKRDGIIRAATALFMTKGYELTSMEAVALKADVSKITIYNHFSDKDELFKCVIQSRCAKLAIFNSYADLASQHPEPALIAIGKSFATLMYNPDSIRLHRIMISEAARHSKTVRLFYESGPQRVKTVFSDLLRQWVDKNLLVISDIAKAAEHYFSLLKGEMHMKVCFGIAAPPSPEELEPHIDAAVSVFLSAYQSKAPPPCQPKHRPD